MRQSAKALVWLLFLVLVPGCALFGAGPASDAPTEVYDRRDWDDASPEGELPIEAEPRPTAKLLQGPPSLSEGPDLGLIVKPGVLGMAATEPGTRIPGPTGIVTIEGLLDPLGVNKASVQVPPPLPPLDKKSDLAPLTQAIQLMLDGRHQDAIQVLSVYDKETQEFFLRVLPPIIVFAKTPISKLSPPEFAAVDNSLRALQDWLRTRCELLINRMLYCKEIRRFADYDALPDNHAFLNATKDRSGEFVQLYVELKNFASVKGEDGAYLTKLACSLVLNDANNKEVKKWVFDPKETTHRSSACLNDFHGNFSFYVPPIPAGTYKLTLQIVDETIPNERRIARKSLDFRVTPVANQTTLR